MNLGASRRGKLSVDVDGGLEGTVEDAEDVDVEFARAVAEGVGHGVDVHGGEDAEAREVGLRAVHVLD